MRFPLASDVEVHPDGQRLIAVRLDERETTGIEVIFNWFDPKVRGERD